MQSPQCERFDWHVFLTQPVISLLAFQTTARDDYATMQRPRGSGIWEDIGNENAILNRILFTLDQTRVPIHSRDISIVKLYIDVAGAVKPNKHVFCFLEVSRRQRL
jgi:hypothetical protein